MKSLSRWTLAAAVACASPVWAADAFTDAVQATYPAYRSVLFKTNSATQEECRQALAQAQSAWQQVAGRFAAGAPTPYDRDTQTSATLREVAAVYAQAGAEIERNQLKEAHETLEKVRDLLAAMRQRNQVVVFSDHMNAYHEQMEHVLTAGPGLLGGSGASGTSGSFTALALEVGALQHLAGRLSSQADAGLRANPEFNTLLKAVQQSVADLRAAVLAQDAAAAKAALGKVKGPYSRLFLRFG
ncbi:MAG: hypothetical protein IPG57_04360 [Burkholderiales bacterium]|nr:hypothetical protein [Burkholderiales bacterium]MBP7519996.1 hypothetical protein [Leptothrix sp. (in: b-proteobacteria)]